MSDRQLTIPGLEPPTPSKPKRTSIQQQIAALQDRVLKLELEVTLLTIRLDGDKDHA